MTRAQLPTLGSVAFNPRLQPFGTLAYQFGGFSGSFDMDAAPDETWLMKGLAGGPSEPMLSFEVDPVTFELDLGLGAFNPTVTYSATVSTPEACAADFNTSGGVDIFDIIAFLEAWNAQDPRTDTREDGSIDIFDIIDFLVLWNAGCP